MLNTLRASISTVFLISASVTPSIAQTVEYYHLDALGSVRAVTDQSGVVLERHDYLPFGDEVTPPASTNPRRFTGKERDVETGLDYFGARYYSAKRARFTTVDPVFTWEENLVDPQRWNRYAYVRNNPLRYTDPDGRCIDGCVLEGMVVIVAAKLTTDLAVYLNSPQGQRQLRDIVQGTGAMITTAANGIASWFQTERRPGTLGKPDHRATVEEEAARIAGTTEVPIRTSGGKKDSRRADAVGTNPTTGAPEIVQVYRPTPAGNIPKRERDAATDIERARGIQPTMVPVRSIQPK